MSRREEGKGFIGEEVGMRDEGGGRDEARGAASFEEGLGANLKTKRETLEIIFFKLGLLP